MPHYKSERSATEGCGREMVGCGGRVGGGQTTEGKRAVVACDMQQNFEHKPKGEVTRDDEMIKCSQLKYLSCCLLLIIPTRSRPQCTLDRDLTGHTNTQNIHSLLQLTL